MQLGTRSDELFLLRVLPLHPEISQLFAPVSEYAFPNIILLLILLLLPPKQIPAATMQK